MPTKTASICEKPCKKARMGPSSSQGQVEPTVPFKGILMESETWEPQDPGWLSWETIVNKGYQLYQANPIPGKNIKCPGCKWNGQVAKGDEFALWCHLESSSHVPQSALATLKKAFQSPCQDCKQLYC